MLATHHVSFTEAYVTLWHYKSEICITSELIISLKETYYALFFQMKLTKYLGHSSVKLLQGYSTAACFSTMPLQLCS